MYLEILKPIQKDLKTIEKGIQKEISQKKVVGLEKHVTHLSHFGGKMLRPAMLLLMAQSLLNTKKVTAKVKKELLDSATAIEILHRATLVHDDIMDKSPLRHNKITAYKKFGSDKAIVLGDWLLAASQSYAARIKNTSVQNDIAQALADVCKGQLLQTEMRNNSRMKESQYQKIIDLKTVALFITSCAAAAHIVAPRKINTAQKFGMYFGKAFQMIDDLEDLLADPKKTGKPTGQDIRAGEMTLPACLLVHELKGSNKKIFLHAFGNEKTKSIPMIVRLFKKSEARKKTITKAKANIKKTYAAIHQLKNPHASQGLTNIVQLLERKLKKL